MFMPSRGGSRGGKDQFDWDDVKADKYRENYLGHSVMAPIGRWQKGKDLTWYNKDKKQKEADRKAEMMAVKEQESMALNVMLGRTDANSARSNNLTKTEISDLFKRGQTERDDGDIERMQGVGFLSARAALMAPDSETNKGVGKSNMTVYEKVVEPGDAVTKDVGKKKKKKEKKEKKKKKKKHSSHNHSSDDDNRKNSDPDSHPGVHSVKNSVGEGRRRHDSSSDEDANDLRYSAKDKRSDYSFNDDRKYSENRSSRGRPIDKVPTRRYKHSPDEVDKRRDRTYHHRHYRDRSPHSESSRDHDRYKPRKKPHSSKY
ncbi:Multiple myeloma tumor-associated protein 2-like protein [Trichoplax sp. H2]|nr:Multiple myeloma tumor-associated protein 2-like protein [Trichoplax sp. H2]|eukprot:RDD42809.1 Multiple myeloma tumor-associated protein 2-like protein [Trichoplax sp. H2]